jgi:hypothetical protein
MMVRSEWERGLMASVSGQSENNEGADDYRHRIGAMTGSPVRCRGGHELGSSRQELVGAFPHDRCTTTGPESARS